MLLSYKGIERPILYRHSVNASPGCTVLLEDIPTAVVWFSKTLLTTAVVWFSKTLLPSCCLVQQNTLTQLSFGSANSVNTYPGCTVLLEVLTGCCLVQHNTFNELVFGPAQYSFTFYQLKSTCQTITQLLKVEEDPKKEPNMQRKF